MRTLCGGRHLVDGRGRRVRATHDERSFLLVYFLYTYLTVKVICIVVFRVVDGRGLEGGRVRGLLRGGRDLLLDSGRRVRGGSVTLRAVRGRLRRGRLLVSSLARAVRALRGSGLSRLRVCGRRRRRTGVRRSGLLGRGRAVLGRGRRLVDGGSVLLERGSARLRSVLRGGKGLRRHVLLSVGRGRRLREREDMLDRRLSTGMGTRGRLDLS